MTKTPWTRILILALPPLALLLWLSVPLFNPQMKVASGLAARTNHCVVMCAEVLRVGDLLLGCKADLLGVSYSCRERLLAPGEVVATYAVLPSLSSLLGVSQIAGTLTRLERGSQLAYSRSVASIVWATLYEGWLFHAIYWPIAALVIWRWPNSRFSQRATWGAYKP